MDRKRTESERNRAERKRKCIELNGSGVDSKADEWEWIGIEVIRREVERRRVVRNRFG